MGVEFLLLFGLGITGVVLTNLLAGETATEAPPTRGPELPEATDVETASSAPGIRTPGRSPEPIEEGAPTEADGVAIPTLPHVEPRLWGHPAPIARLLALLVATSALLSSAIWGLGWLVARSIARAVAGG